MDKLQEPTPTCDSSVAFPQNSIYPAEYVFTTSQHGRVEFSVPPKWSWCTMVTAVFGLFLCLPFGIVAVLAATTANTDHKVRDFERSKKKHKIALGFGIAGICIGCISIVISIALWFVFVLKTLNSIYNWNS